MNGTSGATGAAAERPARRRWLDTPAPADRAAGRRGFRGLLAVVATFGALVPLWNHGPDESPREGFGRRTYEYELDGPWWIDPALVASAIALVIAALLLWAARRRLTFALGLVLAPLAAGVTAGAVVERKTVGRVTPADARFARSLDSEAEVRATLGAPAGHGSMQGPGLSADCIVYVRDRPAFGLQVDYLFCSRDGRVVGRWPPVRHPVRR